MSGRCDEARSAKLRAFGLRVRELRVRARLSQEALADRAGLHRTYVGSVERGERNIALANIHALAAALTVPVERLFAEPDGQPHHPADALPQ